MNRRSKRSGSRPSAAPLRCAGSVALAAGLLLALPVGACSSDKERYAERPPIPRPIKPLAYNDRPVQEGVSRAGGPLDPVTSAALLERQTLRGGGSDLDRVAPALVETDPGPVRQVTINAREMAPADLVRIIVGEHLGRSYMLSPDLNNANYGVTLDVSAEMSDQDLLDLLDALAVLYAWRVESDGEVMVLAQASGRGGELGRSPDAPILEAQAALGSSETGVRLFKMRYMAPNEAMEACKELISEGAKSVVAGRSLVIADRTSQLNRLANLLGALDSAPFEGAEVWTYALAHADPAEAVQTLNSISASARLNGPGSTLVNYFALPRSNRLMVIGRDPTIQGMVRNWIEQIDAPANETRRQKYLYRIQHYDPQQLASLTTSVFSERLERDAQDPSDPGMRLVLNPGEDQLVIVATPRDYADVLAFLSRIDLPRQQVMLQSIIAEVTLTDSLQWGVDYFLSTEVDDSILELAGTASQFGPAVPTGSLAFLATDGFAVLEALDQQTDVAVLSTPTLFIRDKDTGRIQVGGEVPVLQTNITTDQVQDDGNTGVRQEIEYRETGVILTIQPRINENGEVTLLITQTIRDVQPTTSSGIDSPEFSVREIETTATVPHGKTLLLGGIIEEDDTRRVGKVPFLGDIPGVGALFQNVDNSRSRTELVLAITPVVVNTPTQGSELLSDFLVGARSVELALRSYEADLIGDVTGAAREYQDALDAAEEQMYGPGARRDASDQNGAPRSSAPDVSPDRRAEPNADAEEDPASLSPLRSFAQLAASADEGTEAGRIFVAEFLRSILAAASESREGG